MGTNMRDILPRLRRWLGTGGAIRTIRFLPGAAVLAGCAATNPAATLDWDGFIASFAGEPQERAEYVTGTVKVVASAEVTASIAAGNARFERWCSAHGGRSDLTQALARSSPTVSTFHNGLALKSNAEQARGLGWKPIVAVACVDVQSAELVSAMVSEQGRRDEARESQGKVVDKLTRAFFGKQQAAEFGSVYVKREIERTARVAVDSRDREAKRLAATHRLRRDPRVGDRILNGTIIEIRPPLVLVQYDERYRSLMNRAPTEWLRIDGLSAPSDGQ